MITPIAVSRVIWGLFASSIFAQTAPPAALLGSWCTVRALRTTGISSLGQPELKTIASTRLSYTENRFQSQEKIVFAPKYQLTALTGNVFIEEYRILPKELGVTKALVTRVNLSDTNGKQIYLPGDSVLILRPGVIAWFWEGTFFEAVKCKPRNLGTRGEMP